MNLSFAKLPFLFLFLFSIGIAFGQDVQSNQPRPKDAKPVTIPVSFHAKNSKENRSEILEAGELSVKEDGDEQIILSLRSVTNSPLYLSILIQDNVVSSIGNEIQTIAEFIRRLPKGSKVFIGYIRSGTLQTKQKFTDDLEKAAKALRIPSAVASSAPFNPYVEVIEAVKKFDGQPNGRRAVLLISDGLDISRGFDSSLPSQSIDLDRAILNAQRRSIAIYSFYAPTVGGTENANSTLILNAQGALNRLSDETGGRAFFSGTSAPVSFDPFFRELNVTLNRQFALTYLSTHPKKGFHRVEVKSTNPSIEVEHPKGYVNR
jgi:VWFA-related protein